MITGTIISNLLQQQNAEFLHILQDDIDNFPMEQHIQLNESALDEAIEILDKAQEQPNQDFDQAQVDQKHNDYDSDSSFKDLEGDFLARSSITRGIRKQIPLIPPSNQTFQQLPFWLAQAPRDLPQIIQRQANDIPDEFRDKAHDN